MINLKFLRHLYNFKLQITLQQLSFQQLEIMVLLSVHKRVNLLKQPLQNQINVIIMFFTEVAINSQSTMDSYFKPQLMVHSIPFLDQIMVFRVEIDLVLTEVNQIRQLVGYVVNGQYQCLKVPWVVMLIQISELSNQLYSMHSFQRCIII
ncbi:Hypothetical_protein [Hexamita inflata]|uniref:Hypothetical_protein n=1 Tax=Hexamita inflata TaxID=28002 RepID=A0AA86QQG4_9EUKA|nr:Hypothetical protein HINF_LOCUS48732 [Hexamita inflata]